MFMHDRTGHGNAVPLGTAWRGGIAGEAEMAYASPGRREMTQEDAQRMVRLAEEVRGRLLEMSLIAARTLDLDTAGGTAPRFVPRPRPSAESADAGADAGAGDWMEIDVIDGFEVCWG
jgi:hypothetical protein